MAVASLTIQSLKLPCFVLRPGQRKHTKSQLREAVRKYPDRLEFRNLNPFEPTHLSLAAAARAGESSVEVRRPSYDGITGGDLWGVIYIDTRHGLDKVSYLVQ